jgi:hypothetical protein
MSVVAERLVEVDASGVVAGERRAAGEEKTFRSYDPDQVLLMAPVLAEWVPEGDLAHFVSDLVETGVLDLSAVYASYEGERGFPPYDPRLMVKLLVYGYANGVMSSRKLERATFRDVAVRMLCADQHPELAVRDEQGLGHLLDDLLFSPASSEDVDAVGPVGDRHEHVVLADLGRVA